MYLEKIWKHLGQFGGLNFKTSEEPKLRKNWKIGHFNKIPKRDITHLMHRCQDHALIPL